ncbi:hypothetical protein ACFLX5_00595 [Chloroflexota bacterium]
MKELENYRGAFNPHIKYEDFSKDVIVKLLIEYSRTHLATLGTWHNVVEQRFGEKESVDGDIIRSLTTRWRAYGFIRSALNIQGDTVETFFKTMQVGPGMALGIHDIEWDLKNPYHGIFTVKWCSALEHFERQGKGYEIPVCYIEEPPTFGSAARSINPRIRLMPLKLPPRKSKGETACKWEVKLDR